MGNYATEKSEMKFKNQKDLEFVQSVLDDADAALKDKSRISGICLDNATTAGITGGLTAATAAAAAALFPPAALVGGAVLLRSSHRKKEKRREAKELLYKDAIAKQSAIIKALTEEHDADKERIDYLNGINEMLCNIIESFQHDSEVIA